MQLDRPASSSGGAAGGRAYGQHRLGSTARPGIRHPCTLGVSGRPSAAGIGRVGQVAQPPGGGELIADRAEVTGNRVNRGAG